MQVNPTQVREEMGHPVYVCVRAAVHYGFKFSMIPGLQSHLVHSNVSVSYARCLGGEGTNISHTPHMMYCILYVPKSLTPTTGLGAGSPMRLHDTEFVMSG